MWMGHRTLKAKKIDFVVKGTISPREIGLIISAASGITWLILPLIYYLGVKGIEDLTILYSAVVIWFYTFKLFWEVIFRDDFIRAFILQTGSQELQIERP